jgi:general L-amino acid transport system permease protein
MNGATDAGEKMIESDTGYRQLLPARKPPAREQGLLDWLRSNLFSSPLNGLLTLVTAALLISSAAGLLRWVISDASWQQLWQNLRLLAVYRYPADLLWRPLTLLSIIMVLLGVSAGAAGRQKGEIIRGLYWSFAGLVWLLTVVALIAWPSVRWLWLGTGVLTALGFPLGRAAPGLARFVPWLWGASLPIGFLLLHGFGSGGGLMRVVDTRQWGGFMLTLILAAVGIVLSFPIGVALALGRRSQLPAIKYFCITFIEIVRGAPLITWLFIASMMVPLIFNVGPDAIAPLVRGLVAITLFSAAYMAENVRGGLQAVPRGQGEAARALGLTGWQTMSLIVLPQALKAVIPAIVGQAIGLFKDTSLVFIIGLFDFFEIGRRVIPNQPASLQVTGGVMLELSLFMALVYFFFAYRMSVASRQLEKQLGVGDR